MKISDFLKTFILMFIIGISPVMGQHVAPGFKLPDLDGNLVNSQDYRGKYLVIHIATTWCPFCNAEAPYLQDLYESYLDRNVEVLIIDVKEHEELVREKLQKKFSLTFPVLLDSNGTVAASFAPADLLPDLARDEVMLASNIVIDPDGNIIFISLLDSRNFDARLEEVKKLLDENISSN